MSRKRKSGKSRSAKRLTTTKWKHQTIEVDIPLFEKIWEELPKYEIKSFQTLYDYLIVSGVIFLKREIIELVREKSKALKERTRNIRVQCLSGNPTGEVERKKFNPVMYEKDYEALGRFCIEENLKKHWVFESLLREFVEGNPIIINHIDYCKKLNVTQRKKQLARVAKLEYIYMLDAKDAEEILKRNTEKYDKKDYDSSLIQEDLNNILNRVAKDQLDEEESASFESKINRLAQRRGIVMEQIMSPVDLDEEDSDDDIEDEDTQEDEPLEEDSDPLWLKNAKAVAIEERKARKERLAKLRKEIGG